MYQVTYNPRSRLHESVERTVDWFNKVAKIPQPWELPEPEMLKEDSAHPLVPTVGNRTV